MASTTEKNTHGSASSGDTLKGHSDHHQQHHHHRHHRPKQQQEEQEGPGSAPRSAKTAQTFSHSPESPAESQDSLRSQQGSPAAPATVGDIPRQDQGVTAVKQHSARVHASGPADSVLRASSAAFQSEMEYSVMRSTKQTCQAWAASPPSQARKSESSKSKVAPRSDSDNEYPGDLITMLTDHHVQLRGLLNEIAATSSDDRRAAFAQLQRLLAVHEVAELILVHPESRRALVDGERVVAARLREEELTRVEMGTLGMLDPDAPEFEAIFDDFKKSLEKHMELEEREEFPQLREILPPAQMRRLQARVQQAERVAPPLHVSEQSDLLLGDQETRFEDIANTVLAVLTGGL
jgi:hypothetical protein